MITPITWGVKVTHMGDRKVTQPSCATSLWKQFQSRQDLRGVSEYSLFSVVDIVTGSVTLLSVAFVMVTSCQMIQFRVTQRRGGL